MAHERFSDQERADAAGAQAGDVCRGVDAGLRYHQALIGQLRGQSQRGVQIGDGNGPGRSVSIAMGLGDGITISWFPGQSADGFDQ